MILKDVAGVIYSSKTVDRKKNHNFLFHRNQQIGGAIKRELVNVLRRGPITYFSINFSQHESFYDFYNENVVNNFLNSVKDVFVLAYFELKNYQRTETVDLENTKVWLTDVFTGRFLNDFIENSIEKEILKRVTINGSTGSSWLFQRFNKLQLIVTDKN